MFKKFKSTLKDVTTPGGRIGRKQYLVYNLFLMLLEIIISIAFALVVLLAFVILKIIGAEISDDQATKSLDDVFNFTDYIIAASMFVLNILISIKRIHDIDLPAWLLIIPIVNVIIYIALFFKKGTTGPNKYGLDPNNE